MLVSLVSFAYAFAYEDARVAHCIRICNDEEKEEDKEEEAISLFQIDLRLHFAIPGPLIL